MVEQDVWGGRIGVGSIGAVDGITGDRMGRKKDQDLEGVGFRAVHAKPFLGLIELAQVCCVDA